MIRSLTILLLAAGASAGEPAELVFGIIATESQQGLRKDWDPVRADMQQQLGIPVRLFFASDYAGVIEGMRFGKVHAGWFGNKSGIEVVDRANGEVVAQVVDADGNPGYWSLIIVHRDSPITTLEQLLAQGPTLTFSMGDPQSTSGNLVPGYHAFARNGIEPGKHFKALRTANHESNALAVAAKQIDAATFNTEAMFHLRRKHADKAALLREIWRSPLIASDPIMIRRDVPAELKARFTSFFLGYGGTETGRTKLAPLKMSGFRASSDAQLLPYRQLNLIRDKAKLEQDQQLGAAEKAARIAELQRRIDDLGRQIAAAATAAAAPAAATSAAMR